MTMSSSMSVLQAPPGAPLLFQFAAGALLVLHIGGGSLGIIYGAVAMIAKKGGPLHRVAGRVFAVAMLTMTAAAAISAPFLPDRLTGMMGVFTFYLTATAWLAVWRRPGRTGWLETALAAYGFVTAALFGWMVMIGLASPRGLVDGEQPYELAIVGGALAAMAAALDIWTLRRGGLVGVPRPARHVWRVSLALFIAAGSFCLGQQKVMPEVIRGSVWLNLPPFATLAAMAFWLVRIRLGRRWRTLASVATPA